MANTTVIIENSPTTVVLNASVPSIVVSAVQGPPGLSANDVLIFSSNATINQQVLDAFPSTSYGGAKYIIYATVGSTRQVCEILLLHDGANVSIVEYANIITSIPLCIFAGNIFDGAVRLLVTPTSISTNFKIVRTLLPS